MARANCNIFLKIITLNRNGETPTLYSIVYVLQAAESFFFSISIFALMNWNSYFQCMSLGGGVFEFNFPYFLHCVFFICTQKSCCSQNCQRFPRIIWFQFIIHIEWWSFQVELVEWKTSGRDVDLRSSWLVARWHERRWVSLNNKLKSFPVCYIIPQNFNYVDAIKANSRAFSVIWVVWQSYIFICNISLRKWKRISEYNHLRWIFPI